MVSTPPKTKTRIVLNHCWRACGWLYGNDLQSKNQNCQVGILVTLFLALFASPLSALFTERHQGVRPEALLGYTLWCGIIVSLMVCINRGAYDKATKMAGKIIFTVSSVFVLLFAVVAFTNNLPGQKRLPVKVTHCGILKGEKELPASNVAGIELFVPLVQEHFPSGIPEAFQLVVNIDEQIAKEYDLVQAFIYPVKSTGDVDTELYHKIIPIDQGGGLFALPFDSFLESTRFRVRLILIARENDELKTAASESDPVKGKQIYEELQPKYEDRAERTVETLRTDGGVSVSLQP